jgi:hypothetical protein
MLTPARWALRVAGAVLLGLTAYIHLDLWHGIYRHIPHIGPLFIANGIGAILLAIAVLTLPSWFGRLAGLAGAGLEAGTLLGLIIATNHQGGLFGYVESSSAKYFWFSVVVEIIGAIVLLTLAALPSGGTRSTA